MTDNLHCHRSDGEECKVLISHSEIDNFGVGIEWSVDWNVESAEIESKKPVKNVASCPLSGIQLTQVVQLSMGGNAARDNDVYLNRCVRVIERCSPTAPLQLLYTVNR